MANLNQTVEEEVTSAFPSFNDTRCGAMDQHYMEVWSSMQFWCEGVLFTAFGIIGLVANAVSISVLGTGELRKHSFNQLLIALALFDMMFIVVSVPVYSFSLFQILVGNKFFSLLYVNFLYPMSPVTLCASIYMTLAITVERYLAVCKPLLYRNLNATMSSSRRVAMYVLPVAALSVCLNIPKFLETQAKVGDNATEIGIADMRLEPTYMLYYTISQIFHPTLTTGILPMAALIYMNASIFLGIRRTMSMRTQRRRTPEQQAAAASLARHNGQDHAAQAQGQQVQGQPQVQGNGQPKPRPAGNQRSETNLAVVLIGIVLMHIACHTLRVFLAGMAVHLIRDTVYCMREHGGFVPPLWSMCAESISSLLIMINFSGNFLIYCSVLKPFKEALSKIWARCRACCTGNGTGSDDHAVTRSGADDEETRKRRLLACKQERTRVAMMAGSLKASNGVAPIASAEEEEGLERETFLTVVETHRMEQEQEEEEATSAGSNLQTSTVVRDTAI